MRALSNVLRRVILGCACLSHVTDGFGLLLSSPLQQLPSPSSSPSSSRSSSRSQSRSQSRSPVLDGPNNDPINAQSSLTVGDDANDSSQHRDCDVDPWATARKALQDPGCCVISVCSPGDNNNNMNSNSNGNDIDNESENENESNPLTAHLSILQERLADRGPSDIDIRARIDTSTMESAIEDCLEVCQSMVFTQDGTSGDDSDDLVPSATALAEFAMGMASFAVDCGCSNIKKINSRSNNNNIGGGVFLRFVCASSYRAHDPVFHTDKAPLRGYSTLRGVGTEFVTHPCSPLEYLALRSLGTKLPGRGNQNQQGESQTLRCASEIEFIVMKGDYYYRGNSKAAAAASSSAAAASSWWQRAFACVHRSPPGTTRGGRRVILSFDLADGDDDREWHDVQQKRKWRAGMTQRKSKLVS